MEDEAWVSVQAMRGKFEQLQEESPPATSCTPRFNCTNVRSRVLRDLARADQTRAKLGPHQDDQNGRTESDCLGKDEATVCTDRVIKGASSPPFPKISVRKVSSEEARDSVRERSSSMQSKHVEPCTVPSISPNSDNKLGKKVKDGSDSHEKRGRFFTHIRSRSYGNFSLKRDSSVDGSGREADRNGVVSSREHSPSKDWLPHKRKQRSTDNLASVEDSRCASTFEGKQKIVANVMKNMKNKEKPTVKRKLSFSTKIEKELKNMKEKAVSHTSKDKHLGFGFSSPEKNGHHTSYLFRRRDRSKECRDTRDGGAEPSGEGGCSSSSTTASHLSQASLVTASIARAVTEVVQRKSSQKALQAAGSTSSLSSEETQATPPARPPRKKSSIPSCAPRKKGKAPAPPTSHPTPATQDKTPEEKSSRLNGHLEDGGGSGKGIYDTPDPQMASSESLEILHSSDSLTSSLSPEQSRENSPIQVVREGKADNTAPAEALNSRSYFMDRKHSDSHDRKINIVKAKRHSIATEKVEQESTSPRSSIYVQGHENKDCSDEEEHNPEVFPSGLPPKKPPRTFAYDIYKNVRVTPQPDREGGSESQRDSEPELSPSAPIYAIPLKKKNCNKVVLPKPPVRSKSDLSRKDIPKPTIAPKPPHVLAKAKRASLVDPASGSGELKEEEAAMTSEFQRQAHIRYSLRKPQQKPPAPPSPSFTHPDTSDTSKSPVSSPVNPASDAESAIYTPVTHHNPDEGRDCSKKESEASSEDSSERPTRRRRPHLHSSAGLSGSCGRHQDLPLPSSHSLSTQDLHMSTGYTDNSQPMSLGYSSLVTASPLESPLYTRRSMSDETLYKVSREVEEPVYATPIFKNNNMADKKCHSELHYMCSVLFTEEERETGRDAEDGGLAGHGSGVHKMLGTDAGLDGGKGPRSSFISAWKREFRQSCRQVQNKIKKTVIR